MMMDAHPTLIADYACHVGEGPLWHPDQKRLYWVDIPQGRMFRYDPATGNHEICYEGQPIGGFTLQEDGKLLLFMSRGAVKTWDDGRLETVIDEIPEERDNRFNDVIADPEGRVFCGVMSTSERAGRLYRLDPDRSLQVILEGCGTSNGMGFTPDLKQMYHADSNDKFRWIRRFDYDRSTGTLSNPTVLHQRVLGTGKPDGMTVDAESCIWIALWNGQALIRLAPDGTMMQRIDFPVPKVSCVTFAGDDYTDMYITTAGGQMREEDGAEAGALYHMNLGIAGRPEFRSKVGLV